MTLYEERRGDIRVKYRDEIRLYFYMLRYMSNKVPRTMYYIVLLILS